MPMSGPRNLVLFIGAGFSADAKLPVMAKFGEESKRELKNLREHLPGGRRGSRDMAPELVAAGETHEGFRDRLVATRA